MSQIHVLVATTSKVLTAEVISVAVTRCTDMTLLRNCVVLVSEVEELLSELPPLSGCALVLVGRAPDTEVIATRWLERRKRLVVLRVDMSVVSDRFTVTNSSRRMPALGRYPESVTLTRKCPYCSTKSPLLC